MSVIVNATPAAPREAKRDGSGPGCAIVGVGLIVFGLWFGVRATIDFAATALHDPNTAIQAEMEYLQRRMDCQPGEVLQITPLPGGAKSVKCAAGSNMPAKGELRG